MYTSWIKHSVSSEYRSICMKDKLFSFYLVHITYLQLTPFLLAGTTDLMVQPLAPSLASLFKLEGNATHFTDGYKEKQKQIPCNDLF